MLGSINACQMHMVLPARHALSPASAKLSVRPVSTEAEPRHKAKLFCFAPFPMVSRDAENAVRHIDVHVQLPQRRTGRRQMLHVFALARYRNQVDHQLGLHVDLEVTHSGQR